MISEDDRKEAAAQAIFKAFTTHVQGTRQAMRESLEAARQEVEEQPKLLALAEATGAERRLIYWEAYAAWRWQGAEPDYDDDAAKRLGLNEYWHIIIEKTVAWADGTLKIQYPMKENQDLVLKKYMLYVYFHGESAVLTRRRHRQGRDAGLRRT